MQGSERSERSLLMVLLATKSQLHQCAENVAYWVKPWPIHGGTEWAVTKWCTYMVIFPWRLNIKYTEFEMSAQNEKLTISDLPLRIIEVCWNSNDCIFNGRSQV